MKSLIVRSTQLILLVGVVFALAARHPANAGVSTPQAPEEATDWQLPPGTQISQGADGADIPVIEIAPDGSRLIVVYNRWIGTHDNRDPYYRISNDGGATWPASGAIYTSNADSVQVDVAIDDDNTAHAVWVEAATGNLTLKYAREDQWSNTAITVASSPIFLSNPAIVAHGTTLHLVWSQKAPTNTADVYHSMSTNGGNTWTAPQAAFTTPPGSLAPTLAVDNDDVLHLVWEEGQAAGTATIDYARGTVSGNSVAWSAPLVISTNDSVDDTREPTIITGNGGVHVSFSSIVTVGSGDAAEIRQWVYYTRCFSQCTQLDPWSTPTNVSGQYVNVNTNNPFFVIPALVFDQGCVYASFHGVPEGGSNEMIFGINSCSGWSGGGRDEITGPTYQGIFPDLAVHDGIVYLAYERISGGNPQIYYLSGQLPVNNDVYLPLVTR